MSPSRAVFVTALALAAVASSTVPAHASPQDDLAFAVQTYNHDKHSGWVIERFVTLQLPDKCWTKLADKGQRGPGLLASYARWIQRYAKAVTGDDWAGIESQNANSVEANRAVVDKMIDAFKPKFHITLRLEGDDCGVTGNDLWLKYLGNTLGSLVKFPPKSGVAHVTIDVKAKVKDVAIDIDKSGSTFTITAPRDVERSGWSDKIENALQRVSSKG